ncbi:MAG: enoyl-CoA hydratase [Pseudomonadota bacterium]
MAFETIELARNGAVARVTLNRPEALNALSLKMEAELAEAFAALDADEAVGAIVLTGAGRAFSVGVDLKELTEGDGLKNRVWHGPGSLAATLEGVAKPTVAAVNGFAVTGGLELALGCDLIVAGASARFADTHARVGITPSWGMTRILPRLVGPARAKLMSLTGRYVSAAEAADWGLVAETVADEDLISHAEGLAAEMAEASGSAAAKIHRLIDERWASTDAEATSREAAVFDDHIAGVTAHALAEARARVQARGKRVAGGAS